MYPRRMVVYMTICEIFAAVILATHLPNLSVGPVALTVFLVGVFAASVASVVNLRGNLLVGVSLPILFSAGIILGAADGAWIGLFAAITQRELTGQVKRPSFIFNRAQFAILGWVSGALFHALGGSPAHLGLGSISFPLAATALVVFFLNMGLVAAAVALRKGRPLLEVWRVQMAWTTVNYLVMLPIGYLMAIIFDKAGPWPELLFLAPLAGSRWIFALLVQLKKLYRHGVEIILAGVDARDPYTYSHSVRVGRYAELLAEYLGLSEDRVELVGDAGRLHDVGKLGTPDRILNKPGRLSPGEGAIMRRHPVVGGALLAQVEMLGCARDWVLHHHERWDGKGYPDRLYGNEIPIEARIIAVVDAYDAMTSDRPYRPAMSHQAALAEIQAVAGKQLDPWMVSKFMEMTRDLDLSRRERMGKGWEQARNAGS